MYDNTIYMGVNAPKAHQRIIGRMMWKLGELFYAKNKIPYEPFPETMIDEEKTSPTPDILLFDNKTGQNKIIIEVAGTTGMKKDFEKVKEVSQEYSVPEGFVYNYKTDKWLKYSLEKGEDTQNPSFSDLLDMDLKELVK